MGWQPSRVMTLDKLREAQRLRQEGKSYRMIGDLTGVCPATIRDWLNGRRTFDERKIRHMAEADKAAWVPPEARFGESARVSVADLEFLDRLGQLGYGLMDKYLPFSSASELIKHGFVESVDTENERVAKLNITTKGHEMIQTRKKMKKSWELESRLKKD